MEARSKSGAKYKVLLVALLVGVMASESALAQRRGGGFRHGPRVGIYIGAPIFAYGAYGPFHHPYYSPYYYSPYYYPPVVVVPQVLPQAPPVYIEQPQVLQPPVQQLAPPYQQEPQMFQPPAESVPQTSGNNMWYFCPESRTYYPYVKQCPSGWQQVAPQPQG